jgi:hypothetical protein
MLPMDGWQIERERRIVGHRGCGVGLIAQGKAIGYYSRRKISTAGA